METKMKILFSGATAPGFSGKIYVGVTDKLISYVGETAPENEKYDRVIDCSFGGGKLLLPGFYNCHTHAAMTLFRGYGEDMPLDRWLNDCIFPAEDLLTNRSVYVASKLAIAEMIRCGTVSMSDMYFFCDQTVKACAEIGFKANISRSLVSFDPEIDTASDYRFLEGKALFEEWNGAEDGKIKIEMALHAEYSNVEKYVRDVAEYSAKVGAGLQVHLSETEKEHREGKARRGGKTPARFFADTGCFDVPVTAAHCVWVEPEDMALMAEKGVTAVHNPGSNLKLGSGIMPLATLLDAGVNVALGTDGAASNNALDIRREMYLASILCKGATGDTTKGKAAEVLKMISENGARAQRRENCGRIAVGCAADIVLIDLDELNNIPVYDPVYAAVYSTHSSDVCLTMVDGKILYENGEFTTIDIEMLRKEMRDVCEHYFDKKQ